jgi:hypothetical protein
LSLLSTSEAQEVRDGRAGAAVRARRVTTRGFVTDRLERKDLDRWRAIERLALARDASTGQHLHPTLLRLWEWAEGSNHAIEIELVRRGHLSTCTAGSFRIEHFDPRGERHTGVIRINLSNIDQAFIGPSAAQANGFIPFLGLTREERYAEVLGHELAHAAFILSTLWRAQAIKEIVQQTNELLLSRRARKRGPVFDQELRRQILHRDAFLKEIESEAEAVEAAVWGELRASRPLRERGGRHVRYDLQPAGRK